MANLVKPAANFTPDLPGFAGPIDWLHKRGIPAREIGALFGTRATNIRQILWRNAPERKKRAIHPFLVEALFGPQGIRAPVSAFLRDMLKVRPHEDSVILDRAARRRLEALNEEIEAAGTSFWSGVRYGAGLSRLRALLPKVGYSAHHERIRLLARLRQLVSETHLHSGRSASAINEGLASLHLYRIAQQESGWKSDWENVGRSARLVSQAHLLRHEPGQARRYLEIHRKAVEAAGLKERPEYFHQLAIAAFQSGQEDSAPANLLTAMRNLRDTVDYGISKSEHEVRDIGERALNLIRLDWEESANLLEYMVSRYPPDDIHISINAVWTAACGFGTDDKQIQADSLKLLRKYRQAAQGYGRQATVLRLLELTPQLPPRLRRDWIRFALYANAFADE